MNSMIVLRLNKRRKIRIIKNTLIVMLIATSVFFILILKNRVWNVEVDIKSNDIIKYIEFTERLGENNYILDWREIISICLVLDSEEITEKKFNNIAKEFYKYDGENIVGIKSYEKVLNDFNIRGESKNKCYSILKELEKKSVYANLYDEEEKVSFIKELEEQAYKNYMEFGILPSITISQGILESGWGESILAKESNNLFGIKADSRWKGGTYKIKSKENYNDEYVSAFRSYRSTEASIEDHGKFLSENSRYRENGLFKGKNYIEQAKALENAGYSTAKDESGNLIYADKLIRVIRDYNLMSIDTQAIRKQFKN